MKRRETVDNKGSEPDRSPKFHTWEDLAKEIIYGDPREVRALEERIDSRMTAEPSPEEKDEIQRFKEAEEIREDRYDPNDDPTVNHPGIGVRIGGGLPRIRPVDKARLRGIEKILTTTRGDRTLTETERATLHGRLELALRRMEEDLSVLSSFPESTLHKMRIELVFIERARRMLSHGHLDDPLLREGAEKVETALAAMERNINELFLQRAERFVMEGSHIRELTPGEGGRPSLFWLYNLIDHLYGIFHDLTQKRPTRDNEFFILVLETFNLARGIMRLPSLADELTLTYHQKRSAGAITHQVRRVLQDRKNRPST